MKTTKFLGAVLLFAGLFAGYLGINKVSNNTNEVKLLGLDIDISNEKGQNQGFIYLGAGVVLLLAGAYTMGKK